MQPFDFTGRIYFVCDKPDSAFVFDPGKNNQFHWYGKELDKIGHYAIAQSDKLKLELEWNYGREQSYTVISFEGTGDDMAVFVLQNDKTGTLYSFSR